MLTGAVVLIPFADWGIMVRFVVEAPVEHDIHPYQRSLHFDTAIYPLHAVTVLCGCGKGIDTGCRRRAVVGHGIRIDFLLGKAYSIISLWTGSDYSGAVAALCPGEGGKERNRCAGRAWTVIKALLFPMAGVIIISINLTAGSLCDRLRGR